MRIVAARVLCSGAVVASLSFGAGLANAAQSDVCPVVSTSVVADALGTAVSGQTTPGTPAGLDLCDFVDPAGTNFGVGRQANAFDAGTPVAPSALASRYIPSLPDTARNEIDALSAIGINVAIAGYEIATVGGLGDSAVWIKTELTPGSFIDTLLVQRGSDAYDFNSDDAPGAQDALNRLAQAVLAAQ